MCIGIYDKIKFRSIFTFLKFQCVTSFGGYLAEINNSDENAFLVNEARIFNAAGVFDFVSGIFDVENSSLW